MSQRQHYLWLLDAGHAPDTPGKRSPPLPSGKQLREYDLARDIVDRLAFSLLSRGIAHHIVTPIQDEDLKPSIRAELVNAIESRVTMPCRLVSVHANAYGDGQTFNGANGITCLHYPSAVSRDLARVFQTRLVERMKWQDRGLRERTDLTLLKATHCPAVITETGFYTNEEQCIALMQSNTREAIVAAHRDAIILYESGAV